MRNPQQPAQPAAAAGPNNPEAGNQNPDTDNNQVS